MARINLLPWRAERRKARQKEFGAILGLSALVAVALSVLIVFYYNSEISGQRKRNAFLDAQIAEVDKKITEIEELDKKKSKLLARKEVIEKLQSNRSQMVHLFDSLVRTIPDGAVLTAIKQDAETLTLEGRAQSNARVSTYMRNLEVSGWMTKPDLNVIEAKGNEKGLPYEFKLQVKLANPNAPKDEDGDGVPDEPAPPAAPEAAAAAAASAAASAAGQPAAAGAQPGAATAPAAAPAVKPAEAAKPAAAPAKPAAAPAAPTKTGAAS
ncbi:PilN domain-containing protein [Lysobacter firmicutimachus]|uniref:PilN domain-containing protein n=2 Tax=Lysobacter TaxID=68 RepID=A0AAU8MTJ3_9GAMM